MLDCIVILQPCSRFRNQRNSTYVVQMSLPPSLSPSFPPSFSFSLPFSPSPPSLIPSSLLSPLLLSSCPPPLLVFPTKLSCKAWPLITGATAVKDSLFQPSKARQIQLQKPDLLWCLRKVSASLSGIKAGPALCPGVAGAPPASGTPSPSSTSPPAGTLHPSCRLSALSAA